MNLSPGSRPAFGVRPSVSDFPDWLDAIFVRDLRQGIRGSFFVWGFLVVQSLALLAAMIEWAVTEIIGGAGILVSGVLGSVLAFIFGYLLPFSLFNALQPELGRGRNVELLLTSQLSRWQIVRGKLLVASTLSALTLISILPYLLIRYFLGGVELIGILHSMFSLLLSNATMNSIIIGASAFSGLVGRLVIILLLMLLCSTLTFSLPIMHSTTGGIPGNASLELAVRILIAMLCIVLSLQLGRSKLKLFDDPLDPPATLLIFVVLILAPVIHGVALWTGGVVASVISLSVLIAGALMIDPGARRKKQLKPGPLSLLF